MKSTASIAQSDGQLWQSRGNNKNINFYEIQADFYKYWAGKKIEKGKGYKPFKRWEAYMEPRVYPSGNMNLPSNTYNNFISWQEEYFNNTLEQRSPPSSWTELGPIGSPTGPAPYSRTGAGRLSFVRFDPGNSNTMYVGAPDGGLWKSTDAGNSWTTNTDFLPVIGVSDLVIDPGNTNIMYLATGDLEGNKSSIGVMKSTDGGNSWNATDANWPVSNGWFISKLLMNPFDPLNMIISTNVGIFRTTDGWVNSDFQQAGDFKDLEFKPGDPNTLYTAGTEFWKSTDNGVNWNQITTGLPGTDISRIALAVTPGNSAYVYAVIGKSTDQSFLGLYRSTDSGTSFTTRSTSPNLLGYETDGSDDGGQAFYDLSITASASNPDIVTVGGVNHWQSTNGGTNWTNLSYWASGEVHADVHELVYLPGSNTTMFSSNDGGIFKSTDNGDNFIDISNNLAIAQVVGLGLSATNANAIVAGEQDNGTNLKSGSSWENIFGGDGGIWFFDYTNDNTIYIQYVQGDYNRSDDGGASTVSITTGLPTDIDFYSPWVIDPVNPLKLYSGGTPTLYGSTNKGDLWNELGTGTGTGSIKAIAVAPSDPDIIYIVQDDAVSKSIDAGVSFTDITSGSSTSGAAITNVAVSNNDPDKIWITYSGYFAGEKVYRSVNGGTS